MSDPRLSVAIVARRVPVPIFTGINLVVHHLATRLAARYRTAMFVTDDDTSKVPADFPMPVVACGKSGYGDAGGVVSQSEAYDSVFARYYGVPRSRTQWLEREIGAFGADVVFAFGYDLAAYLQPLQARWPVVFDPIDSEVLYLWRLLRSGRLQLATVKHLIMSIGIARSVLSHCDALITVSDEDSDNLRKLTGLREVFTVPNGVDCGFFAPNPTRGAIPGRLIFSGSMGWLPNVQALEWFLENCWERVLQKRPDASLEVVGKGMSAQQQERYGRYRNVQAVGFVDDIRDHVLAAEVSIAPMISGSGIKNKVLESWALGRPVVATALAGKGLQARDGEHLLVAQGGVEFADAVLCVLNDAQLRDRLSVAGRALVMSQYSWEFMADRAASIVSNAAAKRLASGAGRR